MKMRRCNIVLGTLIVVYCFLQSPILNAQTILEAEDAFFSSGTVDTEHAGYTGSGFVNTDNSFDETIEWFINVTNADTGSLDFRYALGKDEHRYMEIYVNGVFIDTIDFDSTNTFTNYKYKSVTAILNEGLNRVKAVSVNSEGAPNMDHLRIEADTTALPYCQISVNNDGNGTTSIEPVADSFIVGTRLSITATANAGFSFDSWSGDTTTTKNPLIVPAIDGFSITANFLNSLPAFPGAEGFAGNITGGRGGVVIEVTNLNNDGAGSLREAINQTGKRTVIFRVSGNIVLESNLSINNGDITIAGQTAPGDGITLQGYPLKVNADNVIIRFIRSRLGDETDIEDDAMNGRYNQGVIIDHCTMSWSVDETASFYDNENFTMQYCLISESLYNSVHEKGKHGYGGIWGGRGATFHHNLLAHHTSRNPRFCGSRYSNLANEELIDFRNNVIFNWGGNSIYGAEGGSYNLVNNYFKSGPATNSSVRSRIIAPNADDGTNNQPAGIWGVFYVDGNYVNGYSEVTEDNWIGVHASISDKNDIKSETEFEVDSVTTHSAKIAFEHVLAQSGASLPKRDPVDNRIISEVISGIPTYGASYGEGKGIIDTQSDVGGWPELVSETPPTDTDHDGMPDDWENANGLDPSDYSDRNGDIKNNGYTNLEDYLNELVEQYTYLIRPIDFAIEQSSETEVVLGWNDVTDNETGFYLERAVGDGDFELLAELDANSTGYTDEISSPGIYKYQLRSFNETDTSLYTEIAEVDLSTGVDDVNIDNNSLSVYPNPFKSDFTIKLNLLNSDDIEIAINDLSGRQIELIHSGALTEGEHFINYNASGLKSGVYYLTIKTNVQSIVHKIIHW